MAGKRAYVSCASQDASLLDVLTAALDAWEVSYDYLQRGELGVSTILPETARNAIRQAEVFLRVCTSSTISSPSMAQELLSLTLWRWRTAAPARASGEYLQTLFSIPAISGSRLTR